MTLLRLRVNGKILEFDNAAPLTFGDAFALRDAADATGIAADQLRTAFESDDTDLKGRALLIFAFLASARKNHALTWREFIWSTPIDGVTVVVDDDEAPPQVRVDLPTPPPVGMPDESAIVERVAAQAAAQPAARHVAG